MEYIQLKKGDKVTYNGDMPYKLGNGQQVNKVGDELVIKSDVKVQSRLFKLQDSNENGESKDNKEDKIDLESMDKEQLLKFAEEKGIDVDNRKGEKKLREELQSKLAE